MKHTVSELTGDFLDRAVCLAEGWKPNAGGGWHQPIMIEVGEDKPLPGSTWVPQTPFFSIDWCVAGPIIERERISVVNLSLTDEWAASLKHSDGRGFFEYGSHPLIAAMRAYVASKFGDTIEL